MTLYRSKGTAAGGVNNGIKDPFQGFDCNLWMLDAAGQMVNRGFFSSVQLTFRNATEPYMELSQRVPRYLDGDFQIGWVAQRGMLDVNVLMDTMGYPAVTRSSRVSRSPRFTLIFYVDAPELIETSQTQVPRENSNPYGPGGNTTRQARGKIVLLNCKLDTFAMGTQSGQRVVANQWEGLAEGYELITDTASNVAERQAINRVILPNGGNQASDTVPNVAGTRINNFYTS